MMQLAIPLVIETKPEQQPTIRELTAHPVDLPIYPPDEQVNILCQAAGLAGRADLWRTEFEKTGTRFLDFLAASAGHDFSCGEPIPQAREIQQRIAQLFGLAFFPVGNRENQVPGYIRRGRARTIDYIPARKKRARGPLPESTKIIIRKRNAMKRHLRDYGMLADQFIGQEYERKTWLWGHDDDRLWQEEKAKWLKPKPKRKRGGARRKTDNDEYLR
ncbi:MAG: hypothetical protein IGS03_16650 [Candidatus Sericytochromatia bacterium]|nr:hypothetical protein [Candidatus Sericytochromatia bacterium]